MLNQDNIKSKINRAVYENYLKLYGIEQRHVSLQEIFVPDSYGGPLVKSYDDLSESYDEGSNILETFKIISDLRTLV